MVGQGPKSALDGLRIAVDRDADVPIGVQIAWAIRARIGDGTLAPGQRLPGLRELAEATGVNFNTVRAVYQRLEGDGLINSRRGAGSFVASTAKVSSRLGRIAASAAREAQASGIDPRDVAAVLYSSHDRPDQVDPSSERRQLLRMQIAALELAVAEIETERGSLAPAEGHTGRDSGPRLLDADELERVRGSLMRRLVALREAVDEATPTAKQSSSTAEKQELNVVGERFTASDRDTSPKSKRRPRRTTRPAPASS